MADALLEPHETSNWEKYQIYFKHEKEVVPKIVQDVIYRHKREFVLKIITDMKNYLSETQDAEGLYKKIIILNQLKQKLDEKLHRIV